MDNSFKAWLIKYGLVLYFLAKKLAVLVLCSGAATPEKLAKPGAKVPPFERLFTAGDQTPLGAH